MASLIKGDVHVTGTLTAGNLLPSDASVSDAKVAADADIDADKLEHQYALTRDIWTFEPATPHNLHKVWGLTGEVLGFRAWCITVPGAATTVTVDLKKNGSTILSSAIVLDNANVAYTAEDAAGFTSTALAAGDVLTAHFTLAGANAPVGAACQLVWQEKAN